jgi:hypothetical protein
MRYVGLNSKAQKQPNMSTHVYILKLEDDCWYIGKTKDVDKRVQSHMKGAGSVWTRLHKPVTVHTIFHDVSPFDEDKYTKIYMAKYGMDKVRGGAYVLPELTPDVKALLQRELWGAQDKCFVCGGNHFVYKCNKETTQLIDRDEVQRRKFRDCMHKACAFIYNTFTRFLEPPKA